MCASTLGLLRCWHPCLALQLFSCPAAAEAFGDSWLLLLGSTLWVAQGPLKPVTHSASMLGHGAGCGSGVFLGHTSLRGSEGGGFWFHSQHRQLCGSTCCSCRHAAHWSWRLLPCSRTFMAQGSHLKVAAGPSQLLPLGSSPVMLGTAKKPD